MKQIRGIASKKHQSVAFRVLMLWKFLQKASIFKGFRTFWATPKPLVLGSSPSAPAKNPRSYERGFLLFHYSLLTHHFSLIYADFWQVIGKSEEVISSVTFRQCEKSFFIVSLRRTFVWSIGCDFIRSKPPSTIPSVTSSKEHQYINHRRGYHSSAVLFDILPSIFFRNKPHFDLFFDHFSNIF